ncbi:hypothetical protein CEP51_006037 [Fusarium floridanum]|uniref:2EXR domain-containing protein n=1 Tax=Fusarium floridanum TaxID=1325733 RepID=A0A428RU94_9HYPO|nr:hypothetical protein CEP51_006037 [Fusarium floridanum]
MEANPATSAQATDVGPLASVAHPPGPLTTFHPFPDLPLELQEKIWTIAIDVQAPRGYNVGFTYTKPKDKSLPNRWGLRKLPQVDSPRLGPRNTTLNIIATDPSAAKFAKRQWSHNIWGPRVPFMLENRSNVGKPYKLSKKEEDYTKRFEVDASRDLMLIPNIGNSKRNNSVAETLLPHEIIAHHFEWPGKTKILLQKRLKAMLPLFPNARVLYVVVHNLQAFLLHPVEELPEGWTDANNDLDWYRQEHQQVEPQTSSMTYRIGDRVYYEIDTDEFPRTFGFDVLLCAMRHVSEWHEREYSGPQGRQRLAFRAMTWRLA